MKLGLRPSRLRRAGVTLGPHTNASYHCLAKARPALPQWVGWLSVLGFGLVFALLAIFLVWVDIKFSGVIYNSEQVCPGGSGACTGACMPVSYSLANSDFCVSAHGLQQFAHSDKHTSCNVDPIQWLCIL